MFHTFHTMLNIKTKESSSFTSFNQTLQTPICFYQL